MKTLTLLFISFLFLVAPGIAQSIQRNMVVIEIATGTWCVYCPGAANAADQLISEGKNVAIIENHNGDAYANNYSNARNTFNAVPGYPNGKFDGVLTYGGGMACPNPSVYSSYLPLYQQRNSALSPIGICFSGSNTGNNYSVSVSVSKLNSYTGNDLRLHLVLTESHIPFNWFCMTEVNFVNRLMIPNENGSNVSFASGNSQIFNLNFTKDPAWVASNCELIAFVQDNSTKEIFNAIKSPLNQLPTTQFTMNDFTANITSGCSPLTVQFNTTQAPGTSVSWVFEGGNPATSTDLNPTVVFANAGSFDVKLTAGNGLCFNSIVHADYINVLASPPVPAAPNGQTGLCLNPANQTYTITPHPDINTYTWEFTPSAAGVMTPNGTSCSINFNDSWTGAAQLKVKGTNTCGTSSWSAPLVINVDNYPGQCPAPTGNTTLCINPPVTQYTTAGITPSTYYMWELTPEAAGTFYQGSNTIEIDWADNFTGSASLRVKANNGTCEGSFSNPIQIMVNAAPTAYAVSGGGAYCGPTGNGLPVQLSNSQINTSYSLFKNGVTTGSVIQGTGSAISFGNQTGAGTYTVQATNQATCTGNMTGNAIISIDPQVPVKPTDPVGPAYVNTNVTPSSEFTSQSNFASNYTWTITPATAGTFSGTGPTATITWNPNYAGVSIIKVQGENTCGASSYSNEVTTSVNYGVGIQDGIKNTDLTLSPNPAGEYVYLYSTREFTGNISIVSSNGKVVSNNYETRITKENRLNTSNLKPGIYNIVVTEDNARQSLKLVIK